MIRIMNAPPRGDRNRATTSVTLWSNLPANTRGMLLMAVFAGVVSLGHVIARHLSQDFHPMQAAFFRTIVPLVILTPILMRQGAGWWRTTRPGPKTSTAVTKSEKEKITRQRFMVLLGFGV